MIKNWRDDWKQGDFPFLFVQLRPGMCRRHRPGRNCEVQLWTAQNVKNTAMVVVITDLGDREDIHPRVKDPVVLASPSAPGALPTTRRSSIPGRNTPG